MIRVLEIVSELASGGVENLLLNYFTENDVFKDFTIEFLSYSDKGIVKDKLEKQGFTVYSATPKRKSLRKFYKETKNVIEKGNYDIVHVHQNHMSFIPLKIAKKCGVKNRIVHSHNNKIGHESWSKALINQFLRQLCFKYANYYWACGKMAGKWLYGDSCKKEIFIMPNAVSGDKYRLISEERKLAIRKSYGIENKNVIIQVGRLASEKNQLFSIQILKEIIKENKNYDLLFVGDGPDRKTLENEVISEGLSGYCKFLGNISNVAEVYSIANVLLLPSFFEGLPVTIIESQFMGIPSIISNNVTEEVLLTNLVNQLPLDNVSVWKDFILSLDINSVKNEYEKNRSIMNRSLYEIKNARLLLKEKYIAMVR